MSLCCFCSALSNFCNIHTDHSMKGYGTKWRERRKKKEMEEEKEAEEEKGEKKRS